MTRIILALLLYFASVTSAFAAWGGTFAIYATESKASAACAAAKGSSCSWGAYYSCTVSYPPVSSQDGYGYYNGNIPCDGSRIFYVWSGTCPPGEEFNSEDLCAESEPPPDPGCVDGEHVVGEECVPDNCPTGQAWNPEKNSCYPTSPAPTPDSLAPPGYYPMGKCSGGYTPDANCTLNPAGYSNPANCDGWLCYSHPGDIVPESEGGGCYQYQESPELLHCLVRPRYSGEGCTSGENCNPIPGSPPDSPKFKPQPTPGPPPEPTTPPDPSNSPPTFLPPPPAYVPPPESTTPPPALVCPVGTTRDATTGICYAPAPAPTPSTHTDPGGTPSPTPATCPAGYTLTSTGQCTAPAQPGPGGTTPSCPPGYTLDGTTCRSVGTIDPRTGQGLPGPSTSGTGTGSACGAPGQPVCAIDWGNGDGIPGWGSLGIGLGEFTFDLESMTLIEVGPTNATCPADVPLPKGLTWSWTTVCSFAEWMRPIFVGMAWLMAGFIVLSGVPRN